MLEEGRFAQQGVKRVGAEMELFITDRAYQPVPGVPCRCCASCKMLAPPSWRAFQLEMNADPQDFKADGFTRMEKQLADLMEKTRQCAEGARLRGDGGHSAHHSQVRTSA